MSLVDADKKVIDEIKFESTPQKFEEVAKRRIKMIYERNKGVFE